MNAHQETQLEQYESLVLKYSKTLDLSSPKKLENFKTAIQNTGKYAEAIPESARVLDIGSGVGLPGIPLAILRPDIQVVLCEIRQKRAAFLERVVSSVQIANTTVYNNDVLKIQNHRFDVVTAQAVGTLKLIYQLSKHLLEVNWMIISNKGQSVTQEIEELNKITPIRSVTLEQIDENTALVVINGG